MQYGAISTYIENGTRMLCGASQTVTISFYARSNITNKKVGVYIDQTYGTGGSPSNTDVLNGTNFTLTSSWQRFSHTFTTTTLSGKTFGTNNDDYIDCFIYHAWDSSWGSRVGTSTAEQFGTGYVDITNVMLTKGSALYDYNMPEIGEVYTKISRYLNPILLPGECGLTSFVMPSGYYYHSFNFPTAMRIPPTLLRVGSNSNTARIVLYNTSGGYITTGIVTISIGASSNYMCHVTCNASFTSGTLSAELDLYTLGHHFCVDARF
jgi:hypothetical protein